MLVYVPTVNIDDVYVENPNFLYGGIDYKAQVDALLQYADKKIVVFDDGSALSKKISDYVHESRLEDIVYSKVIKNVKANLSYLFKRNNKLTNASIFLNMPVVKSALVASQLSRYKVPYKKILSTQVNYSPLLFTLTQVSDRERFYIANAIGKAPFALEDINDLIGSDIRYNWIDYATSVGLDYLFTDMLSFQQNRIFHEELFGQQIYYNTEIVRTSEGSFVHLDLVNAPLSAEETW
jgi:SRSO17 transposase